VPDCLTTSIAEQKHSSTNPPSTLSICVEITWVQIISVARFNFGITAGQRSFFAKHLIRLRLISDLQMMFHCCAVNDSDSDI
jgi:hypothetical protein